MTTMTSNLPPIAEMRLALNAILHAATQAPKWGHSGALNDWLTRFGIMADSTVYVGPKGINPIKVADAMAVDFADYIVAHGKDPQGADARRALTNIESRARRTLLALDSADIISFPENAL